MEHNPIPIMPLRRAWCANRDIIQMLPIFSVRMRAIHEGGGEQCATEQTPVLGLDIGTSHIVAARNNEQNFKSERQLNTFVSISYTKLAENLMAHQPRGPGQ
jgi:hypothetical protein